MDKYLRPIPGIPGAGGLRTKASLGLANAALRMAPLEYRRFLVQIIKRGVLAAVDESEAAARAGISSHGKYLFLRDQVDGTE